MEPLATCEFETAEQFWSQLEQAVSQRCDTDELIDNALRSYLSLTTRNPEYVQTDDDLRRCAYQLYSSPLFEHNAEYIRTQLVYCFLQDDEADLLYITSTFLLADAREHDFMFGLLNGEGAFQRMVDLIRAPRPDEEAGLHRLLMELLYEMARVQKITNDNLSCVDDAFVCRLFGIIEELSGDVTDPYHYPVIKALLVLNEQYMVSAHHPIAADSTAVPLTNKVIKVLSSQGSKYKTFGENIILLLNREDETSLQLLTLKLLYLLFTTPSTYEYFYTNDLHVLVDILVRNLLDLPEEAVALRHTYLRVLYPLLEHTQLHQPPHYKRNEIRSLLIVMSGGHVDGIDDSIVRYFEDVDETTKRLVKRCQTVSWLVAPGVDIPQSESPTDAEFSVEVLPESPSKIAKTPPALPAPRKLKKRSSSRSSDLATGMYLNPQLEARQSSLSMMEVAAQKERPGVKTPSRNPSFKHGLRGLVMQKKERPPPPPKARRSGWRKDHDGGIAETEVTNAFADPMNVTGDDESTQNSPAEDLPATDAKSPEPKAVEIQPQKPLPPKSRRWRGKRTKSEDEVSVRPKEPGRFNSNLPSITTTNIEDLSEKSPFSPEEEEKTLSPSTVANTELRSTQMSSVSQALSQAQHQAIQNIEDTLEKAHITPYGESHHQQQVQAELERESPPLHRPVLAPPGQAPIRGVPGPKMELERSPFLSDNESNEHIVNDDTIPEEDEKDIEEKLEAEVEIDLSDDEWDEF